MKKITQYSFLFIALLSVSAIHADETSPLVTPQGTPKKMDTRMLEKGAKLLQTSAPLIGYDVYLVAFHPLKNNPQHQMIAYHYCKQVNEDFMQCVLFDSNSQHANLNGIEYIISEKLFKRLPAKEREYWHPHNYEILSGQLIAPGIPSAVEKQLMQKKMNSYGKTWHVWMTGNTDGPGDNLPLGDAELAWSFNHDGEINPKLVQERDDQFDVNTKQVRQQRQSLVKYAKPQAGVNAISHLFPGPLSSIPGVMDINQK